MDYTGYLIGALMLRCRGMLCKDCRLGAVRWTAGEDGYGGFGASAVICRIGI